MEYRRFGDKIVARIDRGEEILEQVKELARRENITLASVTALGATNDFTVGVYKVEEQRYYACFNLLIATDYTILNFLVAFNYALGNLFICFYEFRHICNLLFLIL